MKTKNISYAGLAMMLTLWATWSYGYKRGYSKGSQDELSCWKFDSLNNSAQLAAVIHGTREPWLLAVGAQSYPLRPKPKIVTRGSVNSVTAVDWGQWH